MTSPRVVLVLGMACVAAVGQNHNLAGQYVCASIGSRPCDTSTAVQLTDNGNWRWGRYAGTYTVATRSITFDGVGGLATWGPAALGPGTLTFISGDNKVVWRKLSSGNAGLAPGVYYCSTAPGGCQTAKGVEIVSDGTWFWGASGGSYSIVGGQVIFHGPQLSSWGAADIGDHKLTFHSRPEALNAGDVIHVAGPSGTKAMAAGPPGTYNAQLGGDGVLGFVGEGGSSDPLFLDPGVYTVDNGSGRSQVGPFRGSINVAKPVTWVNAAQLTNIDRSGPLTITWIGGNPATEFIVIAGISFNSVANTGRVFVCTEKADAGKFSVPAYVLANLPAAAASDQLSGLLWVGNVSFLQQNRFTASGLSAGYLYYAMFQFQNALFY